MSIPVSPGGAYFGLYSDYGDVYRGAIISYESAVASASAPGARDVGNLAVPGDIGAPTVMPGHPKILSFSGGAGYLSIAMTYDNGYWGDEQGDGMFRPSMFLVELQGPSAGYFVLSGEGPDEIVHGISEDNGQSISLMSEEGSALTGITRIKIWRTEIFPGDPLPGGSFWTNFIGARERI